MKLLVISAAWPPHPSGEATNAWFLCRKLAERGHEVDVLTTRGQGGAAIGGVRVHPLMERWSWREWPRLRSCLRNSSPDAVLLMYIGWTYRHQFMITYAPTLAKQCLPGVPFVTRFENVEGADPRRTRWWSRAVRKLMAARCGAATVDYTFGSLLRDSDRLICLSDCHRDNLAALDAGVRVKADVIPPPANMRVADCHAEARRSGRARLGLDHDAFALCYLGYLYPGKGIERLLEAFARVLKARPNTRLVMIGGATDSGAGHPADYEAALQGLAQQLGIAERVTWTGAYSCETEDTSQLLFAADLCVLPFSRGVQLNNSSFASAAAHGLPILTTRGEALERPFLHAENVCLCEPESTDALAAAMQTLIDEPALRERLSSGVSELSRRWFSWDAHVDRTLAACGLEPSAAPSRELAAVN